MHIYRCRVTLLEATFFSSREISNTYYTEPYLGNFALAYALNFCQSPYFNDGTIHYKAHLSQLNEQGLYVTPAAIQQPQFTLMQFNAQPDAYWYAMGAGAIVTRPDGGWVEGGGKTWYIHPREGKRYKVGAENRPQYGRIRALSVHNQGTFYVLSQKPVSIPRYIRLGKFMSKARLQVDELAASRVTVAAEPMATPLNPADLPDTCTPLVFDLINIPPTPLINHVQLRGDVYQLDTKTFLPAGMQFNVADLPD